jgi:hypothetical protein
MPSNDGRCVKEQKWFPAGPTSPTSLTSRTRQTNIPPERMKKKKL